MLKGFCIFVLFDGHNSIDSAVSGGVTILFGIVRAISTASGVIIIFGLARVSRECIFSLGLDGTYIYFLLFNFLVLSRY